MDGNGVLELVRGGSQPHWGEKQGEKQASKERVISVPLEQEGNNDEKFRLHTDIEDKTTQ